MNNYIKKINKCLFHVILDRPLFYYNISSIIRLSIGLNFSLHICGSLVLNFIKNKYNKPILDYMFSSNIYFYSNLFECLNMFNFNRIFIFETSSKKKIILNNFFLGDVLIFGPENNSVLNEFIKIYKKKIFFFPVFGKIRSYNLSQSVSLVSSLLIKNFFFYIFVLICVNHNIGIL